MFILQHILSQPPFFTVPLTKHLLSHCFQSQGPYNSSIASTAFLGSQKPSERVLETLSSFSCVSAGAQRPVQGHTAGQNGPWMRWSRVCLWGRVLPWPHLPLCQPSGQAPRHIPMALEALSSSYCRLGDGVGWRQGTINLPACVWGWGGVGWLQDSCAVFLEARLRQRQNGQSGGRLSNLEHLFLPLRGPLSGLWRSQSRKRPLNHREAPHCGWEA